MGVIQSVLTLIFKSPTKLLVLESTGVIILLKQACASTEALYRFVLGLCQHSEIL